MIFHFKIVVIIFIENVVCYYGTWATYRSGVGKFDVAHINADLCTHLVYTFVGLNDKGDVVSLDPYLDLPDNWGRGGYFEKLLFLSLFLILPLDED